MRLLFRHTSRALIFRLARGQPLYTRSNLKDLHHARKIKFQSTALYAMSVIIAFGGLSYIAVPFYKIVCTETGIDGTPLTPESNGKVTDPKSMIPVSGAKRIKITFNADVSDSMRWKFVPTTRHMYVVPGETALAFYTAQNPTLEDIVGISTYSVVPAKAAQYFNKIQCFCFEEQKLQAGEEIDMPVFFYIDPEFARDPWMRDVDTITLSYTFFRAQRNNRI